MRKMFIAVALAASVSSGAAFASSHREAPFITKNPKVDGTDFYMFNSYESGRNGYVTVIANYIPLQVSYGGPNFYQMDPEALYEIHIDNTGDAREDLSFQFKFTNALANNNSGLTLPIGQADAGRMVAIPLINSGPIGFSDGGFQPGMGGDTANLNVLESYTLSVARGGRRTASTPVTGLDGGSTFGKPVDYIGTKSFPNGSYAAYARSFIYTVNIPGCGSPARVFVGQRQEGFAVNLGAIFDLINAPANVITDPNARGAVQNPLEQYNITTLAMEIPVTCLTGGGTNTIIGGWTTASLRQARVINPNPTFQHPTREGGAWAQVSRLGMPLVNEVVIGLKDKDKFNASEPKDDAMNFAEYVNYPTLPSLIETLFGASGVRAPTEFPRRDLVTAFLTGVPGVNAFGSGSATAEMLRLNTALAATAAANQNSLGAAGCFVGDPPMLMVSGNGECDPAGFPNGRRPGDDVVDITLRVSMGYLLPSTQAPSRAMPFHDAVQQDASQFDTTFPYLKTPNPGS
jgi:hypothetical protein